MCVCVYLCVCVYVCVCVCEWVHLYLHVCMHECIDKIHCQCIDFICWFLWHVCLDMYEVHEDQSMEVNFLVLANNCE